MLKGILFVVYAIRHETMGINKHYVTIKGARSTSAATNEMLATLGANISSCIHLIHNQNKECRLIQDDGHRHSEAHRLARSSVPRSLLRISKVVEATKN